MSRSNNDRREANRNFREALGESFSSTAASIDSSVAATPRSSRTKSGKENAVPQPSTSRATRSEMVRTSQAKKKTRKTAPVEQDPSSEESSGEGDSPIIRRVAQKSPSRKTNRRSPVRSKAQRSPVRSKAQRSPTRQTAQRTPARPTAQRSPAHPTAQRSPALQAANSNTANTTKGAQRRKQSKPRKTVLVKEIIRLQNSTKPLILRAPFLRLVREILQQNQSVRNEAWRITPPALEALRESSEHYITNVMSNAYMITLSRKQVTLQPRDIQLLLRLFGPEN